MYNTNVEYNTHTDNPTKMKKTIKIFLLLIALCSSQSAFAGFNLGVKGGYTTTLSFSSMGDAKWTMVNPQNAQGLHVGVFARAGNRLYFQPEVLYCREVNENTFTTTTGEIKQLSTTSAVDVPLLFGWRMFRIGNGFNMRFVIGPKLRFDLGSSAKYATTDGSWVMNENYKDDMRSFTMGLDTGVGLELMNLINIEVRYNLIGDLRKTTTLNEVGNAISTNYKDPLNTFNVSLGIKLWK